MTKPNRSQKKKIYQTDHPPKSDTNSVGRGSSQLLNTFTPKPDKKTLILILIWKKYKNSINGFSKGLNAVLLLYIAWMTYYKDHPDKAKVISSEQKVERNFNNIVIVAYHKNVGGQLCTLIGSESILIMPSGLVVKPHKLLLNGIMEKGEEITAKFEYPITFADSSFVFYLKSKWINESEPGTPTYSMEKMTSFSPGQFWQGFPNPMQLLKPDEQEKFKQIIVQYKQKYDEF